VERTASWPAASERGGEEDPTLRVGSHPRGLPSQVDGLVGGQVQHGGQLLHSGRMLSDAGQPDQRVDRLDPRELTQDLLPLAVEVIGHDATPSR
jgi:hypothetical protein